ncbi:methionyl-tRNA synthetase [compost metagenome]
MQIKENRQASGPTLNSCVQIIANLANLLEPFIPFSCEKIRTFLTLERPSWQLTFVPTDLQVQKLELLFERIDVSRIEEELSLLEKQKLEPSKGLKEKRDVIRLLAAFLEERSLEEIELIRKLAKDVMATIDSEKQKKD